MGEIKDEVGAVEDCPSIKESEDLLGHAFCKGSINPEDAGVLMSKQAIAQLKNLLVW